MAIDTQEKRMNAATSGRVWMRQKLATGTIDEHARINIGLGYGGNALSPVTEAEGGLLKGLLYVKASLEGHLYIKPTLEGVVR